MKIYHNPRCSKSRAALKIIKEKTSNFEIIEYLKKPLTAKEVTILLLQLNIEPIDLVRKNEVIWKEKYKQKEMNNDDVINAIIKHPNLMERPIVVHNKKAVIGRPTENILRLFS